MNIETIQSAKTADTAVDALVAAASKGRENAAAAHQHLTDAAAALRKAMQTFQSAAINAEVARVEEIHRHSEAASQRRRWSFGYTDEATQDVQRAVKDLQKALAILAG